MWNLRECCWRCKSNGGIVVDSVAGKISCSECGLVSDLDNCGISIATTEPCDDFLPSDLGNSQNRGSDPVSVATTTKPNEASSDEAIIADMSDRLGLLATVKNQAIENYEQIKGQEIEGGRNVRFAACIYVACRQNEMAFTYAEISSAADGAKKSLIAKAVKSICKKLGIPSASMQIRPAEFAKRYCSTLQMDSEVVKAAQEAAENYTRCPVSTRTPKSVAAVVLYATARISYEKKLLEDILQVTGVNKDTIEVTWTDLYPHLAEIIPGWFANAKDLKKLGSS